MSFRDRHDGGRRLALELRRYAERQPIVLGLPPGGMPVAYEVARALGAPLGMLVTGAVMHRGRAVGALAEGGAGVLDPRLVELAGLTDEQLDRVIARASADLRRRVAAYSRSARLAIAGRTVIVVDDGLATGLGQLAAVRAARAGGAAEVVVAAPVGSRRAEAMLREEAEDVVCLAVPPLRDRVDGWYDDFAAVPDAAVTALLAPALQAA